MPKKSKAPANSFSSKPNQKLIKTKKAKPSDKDVYITVDREDASKAWEILNGGAAFAVWLYMAANSNNFEYYLSYVSINNIFKMSKASYHGAVIKVINAGYLYQDEIDSNLWYFDPSYSNLEKSALKSGVTILKSSIPTILESSTVEDDTILKSSTPTILKSSTGYTKNQYRGILKSSTPYTKNQYDTILKSSTEIYNNNNLYKNNNNVLRSALAKMQALAVRRGSEPIGSSPVSSGKDLSGESGALAGTDSLVTQTDSLVAQTDELIEPNTQYKETYLKYLKENPGAVLSKLPDSLVPTGNEILSNTNFYKTLGMDMASFLGMQADELIKLILSCDKEEFIKRYKLYAYPMKSTERESLIEMEQAKDNLKAYKKDCIIARDKFFELMDNMRVKDVKGYTREKNQPREGNILNVPLAVFPKDEHGVRIKDKVDITWDNLHPETQEMIRENFTTKSKKTQYGLQDKFAFYDMLEPERGKEEPLTPVGLQMIYTYELVLTVCDLIEKMKNEGTWDEVEIEDLSISEADDDIDEMKDAGEETEDDKSGSLDILVELGILES